MQDQTDIRVFLADDHGETIQKMSEFLNAAAGIEVVGTASNGTALLDYFKAGNNGVDVALVDIGMPDIDGLTVVREIKDICKEGLKIIVITGLRGRDYPSEAINKQADGFIAKGRHKDEIIDAINRVFKGEIVYLPDPDDPAQPSELPKRLPTLSPIEKRILCLVLEGLTSMEIAYKVMLGVPHVDKIRLGMMHKLGAKNAAQLGALAEKHGLCR